MNIVESKTFGLTTPPPGSIELFVPGRVCLLGEHSDWAGQTPAADTQGRCLVYNTDLGIHAWAWATTLPALCIVDQTSNQDSVRSVAMEACELKTLAEQPGEYFAYVFGTAYVMMRRYMSEDTPVGGITILNDATTIPMRKGFSTSAAICVLVAEAFAQVFNLRHNGSTLTREAIMDAACEGEWAANSKCGRMDQCVAFGPKAVISMKFTGPNAPNASGLTNTAIALGNGEPFHFVVADLCASKDTKKILADLQSAHSNESDMRSDDFKTPFPADNNVVDSWPRHIKELFFKITTTVNPGNSIRIFLGTENELCAAEAEKALAERDHAALGALLTLAQYRFALCMAPHCSELTAPKLHGVLTRVQKLPNCLVWGGKGVGSQGDGAAQFLCRSAATQQQLVAYLTHVENIRAFPLTV